MQTAIVLSLLKEGNKHVVNNLKVNRNLLQLANENSDRQQLKIYGYASICNLAYPTRQRMRDFANTGKAARLPRGKGGEVRHRSSWRLHTRHCKGRKSIGRGA